MIITPTEAKTLHQSYITPTSALKNIADYQRHVETGTWIAYAHAETLRDKGHDIDPDFIRSALILHDIGKTIHPSSVNGWDFHEYFSGVVLRDLGHTELADVVQTHFASFEKIMGLSKGFSLQNSEVDMLALENVRTELIPNGNDLNPDIYNPENLEEPYRLAAKLLTYTDLSIDGKGNKINWRLKLDQLLYKYKNGNHTYGEDYSKYMYHLLKEHVVKRLLPLCLDMDGRLGIK